MLYPDQLHAIANAARRHLARSRMHPDHLRTGLQMKLAWPPVVVQAIRRVRGLLRFQNHRPGVQRVHRACFDIDHVAGCNRLLLQQIFKGDVAQRILNHRFGCTRLQPQCNRRVLLRFQHIPAFGLRASAASQHRGLRIVRMNLHRKLVLREKNLDQQRKLVMLFPQQRRPMLERHLRKPLSGMRSRFHHARLSGHPGLANGRGQFRVVPGLQALPAPYPLHQFNAQAKRLQRRAFLHS